MSRLHASTTPDDAHRAFRLLIAWSDGDRVALDAVLDEARTDPVGVPGLLFALTDFTTSLGEQVADDFSDQLRARLLRDQA